MRKTGIAREFEKDIMEEIKENEEDLKNNLQDIADDIYKAIKNTILNKEEEQELYELYSQLILGIKNIIENNSILEKGLLDIENFEETELKND